MTQNTTIDFHFNNSLFELGEAFFSPSKPTPVEKPELLLWNDTLAFQLGLPEQLTDNPALQANIFSGNTPPTHCTPAALAYCGHQFGHLNPQLGDGRAHLLGEIISPGQKRFDIQLKGSGTTAFSRGGDGRCALAPALREFIMSEAMYFLGVPTTRCLAVVSTGENVYRDTVKPGAVVTRVASSHIRVGTFQYFAIRQDYESLQKLMDYSIQRHYPRILSSQNDECHALAFVNAVMHQQIHLVTEWMRVGFIHGVMNTDNTAISGETIDFGPCAMMNAFDPNTVYSSIDHQGRYAYGNQPNIALWNVTRLAESLLPLIDQNEKIAIQKAETLLNTFHENFEQRYLSMLAQKIGLASSEENALTQQHQALLQELLQIMQTAKLDYTWTFVVMAASLEQQGSKDLLKPEWLTLNTTTQGMIKTIHSALENWLPQWHGVIQHYYPDDSFNCALTSMQQANPQVIPRNHHMERVLQLAEKDNTAGVAAIEEFLGVLRHPYNIKKNTCLYQDIPEDGDQFYQTFCGT